MNGITPKKDFNWFIAVELNSKEIDAIEAAAETTDGIEVDARRTSGGVYIRGASKESVETFAKNHGIGNEAERLVAEALG